MFFSLGSLILWDSDKLIGLAACIDSFHFAKKIAKDLSHFNQAIQAFFNQASGIGMMQLLYACDFFLTDNESMNRR